MYAAYNEESRRPKEGGVKGKHPDLTHKCRNPQKPGMGGEGSRCLKALVALLTTPVNEYCYIIKDGFNDVGR